MPLLRAVAELAGELGHEGTYEFLLGRFLDANLRQYTLTPPGPADLMAAVAGPAATVLDPAAGTGALLRAVGNPSVLYAQDADPDLTALTALRLALHSDAAVRARCGDTLRADAFPEADAVLVPPAVQRTQLGPRRTGLRPPLGVRLPGPHRVRTGLGAARAGPAAPRRHSRAADAARRRLPPLGPPHPSGPAAPRRSAGRHRAARGRRAPVRHPPPPVGAAQARGGQAARFRTAARGHRRAVRRGRRARQARLADRAHRRPRGLAVLRTGGHRGRTAGRQPLGPRHRAARRRCRPGPGPPCAADGRRWRHGRAAACPEPAHRHPPSHRRTDPVAVRRPTGPRPGPPPPSANWPARARW